MSIKLMSAAWELEIPSTEKMVLLCLCDFANDDGRSCHPSVGTLSKKTSKDERTVQRALKWLEENGFLKRDTRPGTSTAYLLDPRQIVTPVKLSPPSKRRGGGDTTPPKPPINHQSKNTQRAHVIPDGWKPEPFGRGSKCCGIIATWPDGELETQIEHFVSHHRGKGNRFVDWQDAWKTWVLNSRRWAPQAKPKQPATANDFLAHLTARRNREMARDGPPVEVGIASERG